MVDVGAAFLASLRCVGPLAFVAFWVAAGLAGTFEPLRPAFTLPTVGLLGTYVVYRRRPTATCAPGEACAVSRDRSRDRRLLWIGAVVALAFLTFPQWSLLLI